MTGPNGAGAATGAEAIRCPLTGSPDVEILQRIPAGFLIESWRRDIGIDVRAAFDGIDSIAFCESRTTGLRFFAPPVTGAADMYAALRRQGWYDPPDKFEFSVGAAATKPGDRVLYIGCGAGHFASHVPGAEYAGHDDNADGQGAATLSGDLGRLARDCGATFDVVAAFQVLEHAADPRDFLRQCLALLKPGGTLVIGVPDSDSYLGCLRNFVLNAPPHHVTWWNAKSLTALAGLAGLEETALHVAPVEEWEARLYWMARLQPRFAPRTADIFAPRNAAMFQASRRGRVAAIAAYLLAGLARKVIAPAAAARGATTVLVGRKPASSS